MKQSWHLRSPARLEQVRSDVEAFCSTLHVVVEGEVVWARGSFPVRHGGEELDRYLIEIEFPFDYPDWLPIVREVGGRIQWTADNHIYPQTGVCCVLLPEDRWWSFPPRRPFTEYLRGPLHNYFLGQSVVATGEKWPFGEHPHGALGVIAFYQEKFGTNDEMLTVRLLGAIAEGKLRGHWPCPCESGRIMRQCHPGVIETAKRMPSWAVRESWESLRQSIKAAQAARSSGNTNAQSIE